MSHGKNKTSRLDGTGTIGPQSAPSWDFLYECSTVKNPNYNIGDRVCLPDGRVFRYAKAGGTLNTDQGAKFWNEELIAYVSVGATQSIGDKEITLTVVAGSVGEDADGVIDEDELRGGYIIIYTGTESMNRGIIGNTALAAAGTSITIYLDAALNLAVDTGDYAEVLGNPYAKVYYTNNGYSSVAGIPVKNATVGQYVWLQTWGPCWVGPGAAGVGGGAEERQCVFGGNGALFEHNVGDTSDQRQHAGFIINKDSAGGDGPPFIMLQISI